MEDFRIDETGVSPLFGVVLLVGLTITMLLAIAVMTSVFTAWVPESLSQGSVGVVPQANIVVDEAKGGLLNDIPSVNFNENWIILSYKTGSSLNIARTKIQIKGYGETQDRAHGTDGPSVQGNIVVEYTNLEYEGKLEAKPNQATDPYSPEYHGYEFHNPELSNGFWDAREKLILNGEDSKTPGEGEGSTVKVYMEGIKKTNNNWRFKKGGQITITIMDAYTDNIISVVRTIVKPAKQ